MPRPKLPRGVPFEAALARDDAAASSVLLVVRPRRADWVVTVIPVSPGSFTLRRDLRAA